MILLIKGLVKGLGPNQATFSTSSIEVYYYIVHSVCKLEEEFFESIFYILTPTNQGLVKVLGPSL